MFDSRPSYSDSLYSDIQPSYKDSLMHHGIKGQKWGVRRYQNPDGSLTPAGKRRYDKVSKLMDSHAHHEGRVRDIDKWLNDPKMDRYTKQSLEKERQHHARQAAKLARKLDKDTDGMRERITADRNADRDRRNAETRKRGNDGLRMMFDQAREDNPKLSYDKIYKEMKVDMNSEDPDVYRNAEFKWFQKHGYAD